MEKKKKAREEKQEEGKIWKAKYLISGLRCVLGLEKRKNPSANRVPRSDSQASVITDIIMHKGSVRCNGCRSNDLADLHPHLHQGFNSTGKAIANAQ
ncbi:hypothetical protein CDAR_169001 [Caerostris darwini]|uniref:Uncharacterized protein n=1 Tax=Caerostris darwini TaxID=1538125 RepID=A0AAV4WSD8_9ARAC|nr:hypothetical protein CDAR_169001 [Caerostris darwini]